MTLIVALKYQDGNVLASDTRVMYGLRRKRDSRTKVTKVNNDVAIAAAGLVGAIEDILGELLLRYKDVPASFDEIVETLSRFVFGWWEANKAKFNDEEIRGPDFVLVSREKIRVVYGNGYSEEIRDYSCVGSGDTYGDFILQGAYESEMSGEKAKELAIYTIVETSKVDPTVGGEVSLVLFNKGGKLVEVPRKEIDQIASQFPRNIFARNKEGQKAEQIVLKRDELNNTFNEKYGFKLFLPHEKAILKLHETCRDEDEFSLLISSLGILVDEMNIEDMRKHIPEVDKNKKSIGLLNEFLKSKGLTNYRDFTDGFDKIRTLRSAHFPVHATESEFISLAIDLVGKFPPDWGSLWIVSLDLYLNTLLKILKWVNK